MKSKWILYIILPCVLAACGTLLGTPAANVEVSTAPPAMPPTITSPVQQVTVMKVLPTLPPTPTETLMPPPFTQEPPEEELPPPPVETPTLFSLVNLTPTIEQPPEEPTEEPAPVTLEDTVRYFSPGGAIVYHRATGREVWMGYFYGGDRIPDPASYNAVVMGLKEELRVPCSTLEGDRYEHVLVCIAPKAQVDPYLDDGKKIYYRLEKTLSDGSTVIAYPPLYRPIETVIYPPTTTPTPWGTTRTPYPTATP
ncbi:MAG: hypothetical protein HPY45_04965 [Anaerolineae bacterium]|nr:hypothetical protein [Anaerolineae bacterium]